MGCATGRSRNTDWTPVVGLGGGETPTFAPEPVERPKPARERTQTTASSARRSRDEKGSEPVAKLRPGGTGQVVSLVSKTQSKDAFPTYTADEVQQKGTSGGIVWVIVQGNVIDATSYMEKHPGGPMMIKDRAGTDVTGEFDEIHSRNAWKMMESLKIGVVGKQPRNNLALPNAAPPKALAGGIGIPDNASKLKVVSRETIDEDHICLRLDGDLRWSLGVGQHVFSWKAASSRSDDAIARPYTPLDVSRNSIKLLVKRYPNGRMSEHLHDPCLKEISVTGPSGKPLEPYLTNAAGPVVMFAAGTGVAPFFRCLRHSISTGCQCLLIWSFRGSPVPLLEELAGFQLRSRPNQFVFGFLGDDFKSVVNANLPKSKGGVKVDPRLCGARLLRAHVACAISPGAGFTKEPACAFICGPPQYHADVNSMLKNEGFKGQIHELG
eukprot:gnl/MRDRNA2_/MRDRNA2_203296_c0_seq1.p1 gnl/MRDRNA2_/MRDRNA2_203296_c0~~gnl/MRDRNA2_/MRDRNA2_203296_c0_seq1.p1  ORF type:complete len:438 (-),score=59.41 gnl/MRDRNA2_/MRDRNA2_203296_c0_seq1:54-1367(-)